MQTNKINSKIQPLGADVPFETKEITKLIFHSLLRDLAGLKEELSDYETKQLVLEAVQRIPGFQCEWGKKSIYGKNKLIIRKEDKVLIMDLTPMLLALKLSWNAYMETIQKR